MVPSTTKPGIPKLSEVARKVVAPSGITSTGWPAVEATCRDKLGITFDGWQSQSGRLMLAKRDDGKLAATIGGVGMSICRQAGKTHLLSGMIFGLSVNRPGMLTVWSAHHARTHGETFLAMQAFAERRQVAPYIKQVFTGSGDEEIRFRNGSRILFGARERGFGRGIPGVDVIVADEAQIMSDRAVDAQLATMNTSDFGLAVYAGTPPRPDDPSEAFTRMRSEAWLGQLLDAVWIEFGADSDADPDSHKTWALANPSFPHRTPAESILRLQRKLAPDSFLREGLGIWDESTLGGAVISADLWQRFADQGPIEGTRPDALAVDMSHSREISVTASWRRGDQYHLEEVWSGGDLNAATLWIKSRTTPRMSVVIDGASPAAAMIPALRGRRVAVNQTTAGDMAKACGLFEDMATSGLLTHADQESVNSALEGGRKRPIRDAGGWGWDRRDETVNIAPLVSVTLALFGASMVKKSSGTGRSSRGREAMVL